MIAYFFVFTILSSLALLSVAGVPRQINLYFSVLSVFLLISFAGFRGLGVGIDDYSYNSHFVGLAGLIDFFQGYSLMGSKMEPGYVFLATLIKTFSSSYNALFFIVALISVGLASINYFRYTPYFLLALLLFFVHTYLYRDLNQIRAAIAAAIGLLLIYQIHEKQHKKIIFTILISSLFHVAALTYFLVYLLSFFKVTRKRLCYGLIFSIFIGFLGVSKLFILSLPDFGYITMKVLNYANSSHGQVISLYDVTNIKNIFILLTLLYFWQQLSSKVKYFEVFILFYFTAVSWRLIFTDFGILAARISTFFGIVEVLLVPALLFLFKQKLMVAFLIVIYAFLTLYLNICVKEIAQPYYFSFIG